MSKITKVKKEKKIKARCEGEAEGEKHEKVVCECSSCGSRFCEECRRESAGECPFCEPPYLTNIN